MTRRSGWMWMGGGWKMLRGGGGQLTSSRDDFTPSHSLVLHKPFRTDDTDKTWNNPQPTRDNALLLHVGYELLGDLNSGYRTQLMRRWAGRMTRVVSSHPTQ